MMPFCAATVWEARSRQGAICRTWPRRRRELTSEQDLQERNILAHHSWECILTLAGREGCHCQQRSARVRRQRQPVQSDCACESIRDARCTSATRCVYLV